MCDICGVNGGHARLCPYYAPPKAAHYCSSCGEGIYEGEEYIENLNGECRHYECFHGLRDLVGWLGYKVKTMEDDLSWEI